MDTTKSRKHLSIKEIWKGIRVVLDYSQDHKKDFKLLLLVTFFLAGLDAFIPYIWGLFIDSVITKTGLSNTGSNIVFGPIFVISIWFVVVLSSNVLEWYKNIKQRKIEETLRITYRLKASYKILQLPLYFHVQNKLGEVTDKLQRGSAGVYDVLTQIILENAPRLFTSIVMVGIIFSIKPIFGVIVLIGLVLSAITSFLNLKQMAVMQRKTQEFYKEMWGKISDSMSNFRIIKDFSTEDYEYNRISGDFMNNILPYWYGYYKKMRGNSLAQGLIGVLTRLVVIILSLKLIFNGNMSVGQLIAVNSLVNFGPILTLINTRHRLQNNIIAIEDAEIMLATPPEIYEPLDARRVEKINGSIEFKDVSFSYEGGTPIFKNLNFSVHPGETIAFVGESGVGKSTLIDLLLGYYFPTEGQILVDGIDIRKIPLKTLRGNMGIVPQEISLFNDSVFNNIKYGSFDANKKDVEIAATKAHCMDFINKFSDKWEQVVGERGMKLSTGQKQRIAIARAFLKDPSILILDEPTSALDANSENVITSSIESLLKDRTTFIVAHRLSTIRKADRIFVFKDGKIVEEGSHKILVAKNGEYAKLYKLQNKTV